MKTNTRNKGYISNLTAIALAVAFCLGAGTFTIVWQHQSNVRIAKENQRIETNITRLQRHQSEINAKIAAAQTLETLSRLNTRFQLNLAAVREQQIVRVTRDPRVLLDMKRNMERIGFLPSSPEAGDTLLARPAGDTQQQPATIRFVSLAR